MINWMDGQLGENLWAPMNLKDSDQVCTQRAQDFNTHNLSKRQ